MRGLKKRGKSKRVECIWIYFEGLMNSCVSDSYVDI